MTTVRKIEKQYVGKDCLQIMITYKREIVIFNNNGIQLFHKVGSNIAINKYLEDDRRKQFPYFNIPYHIEKIGLFNKCNYTNQLFEFDVPYIIVSDGLIIEQIALKDDNGALLVTKIIDDSKKIGNKSHVVVNRKELEKIYTNEKNKFVLHLEDEKYIGEKPLIATLNFKSFTDEKEIYNTIKCQVINGADYIRKHSQNYQSSVVEKNLIEYPQLLDYMRQMITDDDLTKLIFNVGLKGSRALILNANENNIYLKYVFARFIKSDKYIIDIIDLPVNKYNLEQLKNLQPKIFTAKEPKISLKLNPNINKEDIQKAKQKIKTFGK